MITLYLSKSLLLTSRFHSRWKVLSTFSLAEHVNGRKAIICTLTILYHRIRGERFAYICILFYLFFTTLKKSYFFTIKKEKKSMQGRPPQELEKGAVRCDQRVMQLKVFKIITAPLLPHFLDSSMSIYYIATFTSFSRLSI